MKVLKFVGRFLGTSFAVAIAGTIGTYFIGWRTPLPLSWVWSISSIIGGFIASSIFGVGTLKIIVISFAWPFVICLALGMLIGLGVASFEFKSRRSET